MKPRMNGPCPKCHTGTMKQYKTRSEHHWRLRYLKCDQCGHNGRERLRAVIRDGKKIFVPPSEAKPEELYSRWGKL